MLQQLLAVTTQLLLSNDYVRLVGNQDIVQSMQFFSNYSAILETLTFISEEDTSKCGADANSLFLSVSTLQFFFHLTVLNALLEITNVLSEYHQHEQINM